MKLKENHFDSLEGGIIRICKIGDEVDTMWGMSCVLLTTGQIKALLNGDCVWFTDGEYATVLRAEPVDYRHVIHGKWMHRMCGNIAVSWVCSNCYKIHWDGATPFCPHCGAKMSLSE